MTIGPGDPDGGEALPYAGLSPDLMLGAIEAFCQETHPGLRCTGAFLALNSYENRVVAATLDGKFRGTAEVVAKFYRPGRWSDAAILEEHGFTEEAVALGIPAVAPLRRIEGEAASTLFSHGGYRMALFERRRGRPAEMATTEDFRQMGRLLGRLHALGRTRPFRHRPEIGPDTYGEPFIDTVEDSNLVPADVRENYLEAADTLLDAIRARFAPARLLRLHGDCHLGNILVGADGPFLVDFDDCCTGPAVQDLWMLLGGGVAEGGVQFDWLLEGYTSFCVFDSAERALIEPLRALRMIRHNGWLAQRWSDPAFPRAFPQAAGVQYWQEQISALREQLAHLDAIPGSEAAHDDGPLGWEWEDGA